MKGVSRKNLIIAFATLFSGISLFYSGLLTGRNSSLPFDKLNSGVRNVVMSEAKNLKTLGKDIERAIKNGRFDDATRDLDSAYRLLQSLDRLIPNQTEISDSLKALEGQVKFAKLISQNYGQLDSLVSKVENLLAAEFRMADGRTPDIVESNMPDVKSFLVHDIYGLLIEILDYLRDYSGNLQTQEFYFLQWKNYVVVLISDLKYQLDYAKSSEKKTPGQYQEIIWTLEEVLKIFEGLKKTSL